MGTTSGSFALLHAKPKANATVVDNVSFPQFASSIADKDSASGGWSDYHRQGQSIRKF